MRNCENEKMIFAGVKMGKCEDDTCRCKKMRKHADGKMVCVDVKVRKCEDEKMICVDVKMRRCEDEKMICEDVKMGRCENEKVIYKPPLLEERWLRRSREKMVK